MIISYFVLVCLVFDASREVTNIIIRSTVIRGSTCIGKQQSLSQALTDFLNNDHFPQDRI